MIRIKAVIFDLDDTLYDCTGLLTEAARRRAAKAMVAAGLPLSESEAVELQVELTNRYGPRCNVFDRIAEMYQTGEGLVGAALSAYNSDEVEEVQPFPDVAPALRVLRAHGYRLFLVTVGVHRRQEKKIERLGLREFFDEVVINDSEVGMSREECYIDLMTRHALTPQEVVSVGDRINSEIRACNALKMTTVQMLHGRFRSLQPKNELEEPDYRIERISELPARLASANRRRTREQIRVVAVGGGTGLPMLLQGLKAYTRNLTAIVTVTDSGRSSGRLRRGLGVLPPGDARNCLVALSRSAVGEERLYQLFQYRFDEGDLEGMSFGNLLLAALEKITGSFEQALRAASEILAIEGKVLPSTLTDTHICARLEDGTVVREEFNVRATGKSPIAEVFLEPADAHAAGEAIQEIEQADLIVFGPGSLYTSVISNLLVDGITAALRRSNARLIYVCNIVTQPGQTDGYTASDHVKALIRRLGDGMLDAVLVNNRVPERSVMERYEKEGAALVISDPGLRELGIDVVEADLFEGVDHSRVLWEKQDLLRHDPEKLARVIMNVR